MKKLLILLLFLPSLLFSQDLPTVYASSEGEKYIDREEERRESEMNLKQEIKDLTYEISQITEKQYQEEYKGTEYEYLYQFYNEHGYISRSDYLDSDFAWGGWYVPSGVRVVYASSTLVDERGRYNYEVNNIGDEDLRTAWVEGESDYGIGEYIEFEYYPDELFGLWIYNGFQKTIDLWKNNSRVKTFKVYINNDPLCFLELEDKMEVQRFDLESVMNNNYDEECVIRLEIYEVYKGEKWKDVCITDILYKPKT
jgi:hypothetical protein